MGNHPSAVVDDGQSSVNKQTYTVSGNLHTRAIMASTVQAKTIYARSITCQTAHIQNKQSLNRNNYPNPPHRNITAHTVNADVIYADEINCKTLKCYEVYVGDGDQWKAKRVQHIDANRAQWNGREDCDSEDSDDDDELAGERSKRKKALAIGLGGALAAGLGGAAFAFFKNKSDKKEEAEEKEKQERERREKEEREKKAKEDRDRREKDDLRKRQEDDDRRRRDDEDRHRRDDEDRRRRDDDDRRRREEDDRRRREDEERNRRHDHQVLPNHNNNYNNNNNNNNHCDNNNNNGGYGNFHLSSRNVRLWSDGNHCFLIADCDTGGGHYQESRIDLDEFIAVRGGQFYWVRRGETGNWSGQAQRWEIITNGSTIACELALPEGGWGKRQLDLAQHISNQGGHLTYNNW
jgi:hypothetical protein